MLSEFEFSQATAAEMVELLDRRADQHLPKSGESSAVLGAVLLVLVEVLRRPIEKSQDRRQTAENLIDLSARWLRTLLEPVTAQ